MRRLDASGYALTLSLREDRILAMFQTINPGGRMANRDDAMIINSLVRQALTSAQEVMGDNGLNAVLRTCGLERFIGNFPPDNLEPSIQASQYAKLNEAIEQFYGRGGKGMLRRIGKASFHYGVRDKSALLGGG